MIAQPDSSSPAPALAAGPTVALLDHSPLSASELYQLTLYKWRYALEAFGFETDEVRELMFLKWLYASQRVLP